VNYPPVWLRSGGKMQGKKLWKNTRLNFEASHKPSVAKIHRGFDNISKKLFLFLQLPATFQIVFLLECAVNFSAVNENKS